MVVRAAQNIDREHPVIFLSGGPGSPSLVHVETLVTNPAIRDVVVDRDWVFSTSAAAAARFLRCIVSRKMTGTSR